MGNKPLLVVLSLQNAKIAESENFLEIANLLGRCKGVIRCQLAWVVAVMKPLYDLIKNIQKESGGILDIMGEINR